MTSGPQDFEITDQYQANVNEAIEGVDKAIRHYIEVMRGPYFPDDPPYVQGWTVGVEWTNIWNEQKNSGGRDIITPYGQMLSLTLGLGVFISRLA